LRVDPLTLANRDESVAAAAWFAMHPALVAAFLDSTYAGVVDAKMWRVFARPSAATLLAVALLPAGSVFLRDPWCRCRSAPTPAACPRARRRTRYNPRMQDARDKLLEAPLLRHLDPADRDRMVAAGNVRRLPARQTLFHAGDPADAVYILADGKIKMVRHTPQGKEMLLHVVRPGESFAEAALLGDGTYPASAVAVESSVVWAWARSRLLEMVRNTPDLALGLVLSVSTWTRRLASQLELFTQRRVEERLAIYLQARAGDAPLTAGDEVLLRDAKNLIAAQIGTVPEVLSRTFRRLEEDGVLEVLPDRVRILDASSFHDLAAPLER
jgi:CRP/FNR family transcriptional regulator